MIPTRYKAKLPKTLSYPIGAQDVSVSLKGVPQESALTIGFYDMPTILSSQFRKLRERSAPYPIFSLSFRNIQPGLSGSNTDIDEGFYNENWEILVYPVPREHKFAAHTALLSEGLPQIRKWLSTKRSATWKQGRKHCNILFVENEGKVIVQESDAA